MKDINRYICVSFLCGLLLCTACSPCALREAQDVVAQTDCLWNRGEMYRDSAKIARAYQTLGHLPHSVFRLPFSDSYLHACYHYGRLLREKDDPVAAMQAFINATHTRSNDYHFLGRVYSNMGSFCHMAGNYPLSYDMFSRSATMYLDNTDTLLYYYSLNDMAFELSIQKDSAQVTTLLDSIRSYPNSALHIKTWETEAQLHQALHHYNRVVSLVDSLQAYGYNDILGYTMKARAFNYLNMTDSAMLYAQKVVSMAPHNNTAIAAYYILTHDSTLTSDSILVLSSSRADVQKAWAYSYGKLTQSMQLLEQDLSHKPCWTWLYSMIATLLVIGVGILVYVYRRRRKLQLLSQHINVLENIETETIAQMRDKMESNCELLKTSQNITIDLCWKDFAQTCRIIDQQFHLFASKLRSKKGLNETETRLCILVLIGFNEKEISRILPYASNSVGKLKYRTSQKIGTTAKNLRKCLFSIAIDAPMD